MDPSSPPQDSGHRLVIGIGNPGDEYDGTRHNVGFEVLDLVARQRKLEFGRLERDLASSAELRTDRPASVPPLSGRIKARVASTPDGTWHLVKPLTYVNLSGLVAGALSRAWAIPARSIFVVADDLDLPLGRIRIRPSGSSGGHRGLRSIEQALATQDFPRLRLGIGRPPDSGQSTGRDRGTRDREASVDHVLSRFAPEERKILEESLLLAAQAVSEWLGGSAGTPGAAPPPHASVAIPSVASPRASMDELMNRYNNSSSRPSGPTT